MSSDATEGSEPTLLGADPLLIDGATGSMLEQRGVPVDPVCWHAAAALTHPDALTAVHREHLDAGAQVITTNTFATARFVLAPAGHDDDFESINRASVEAAERARDSVDRPVLIAGAISCLAPGFDTSNYPSATTEANAYRELAETLAELGVDVLALEMMQDTVHAPRAIEAAQTTGLPIWIGLSCRVDEDLGELMGFDFPETRFATVARELASFAPAAMCVMHTPVDAVPAALDELRSWWDGTLGVYPELGSFDPVSGRHSQTIVPGDFAQLARTWHEAGVSILGGCCGALPAHIAALAQALGTG